MEHKFNVELACKYGIEEAIMIDNIYFWIKKNVANGRHYYEARYWTYNTAKAFSVIFPYINTSKIYRILSNLEQKNVIIKGKFNINVYNQTNWYSFTDEALAVLNEQKYDVTNFSSHFSFLQNGNSNSEKCINYNTDIEKTYIKNEIDKSISKKADDLFETCWIAYRRKGSKKKAKEYWSKLTDDEKASVLPHVKAYTASRELAYQKDFERYLRDKIFLTVVFARNTILFDPDMTQGNEYKPICDGGLLYNENHKCYIYIGYYNGYIPDGYEDNDRPDGATVMLNNGRGNVVWNSKTKKWEKKDE